MRTYGDVSPGAPRFAGAVLAEHHDPALPWWRVVRADGSVTQGARQRRRLEAEGVPFRGARVEMAEARAPDVEPPRRVMPMPWIRRDITLRPRPRGFHLITGEIEASLPELRGFDVGVAHLFIRHTSASLTLNENASPDVRRDFEAWFTAAVPERFAGWTHTLEGPDDMPAHIKSALLGASVTLPITGGRLDLGTWQGVYLGEHRDAGGPRTVTVTVHGDGSRPG